CRSKKVNEPEKGNKLVWDLFCKTSYPQTGVKIPTASLTPGTYRMCAAMKGAGMASMIFTHGHRADWGRTELKSELQYKITNDGYKTYCTGWVNLPSGSSIRTSD